jgi:DNA-binding transcriptional LysR family regulator
LLAPLNAAPHEEHETIFLDRLFAVANIAAMESFAGIEAFARVVERGSFTAAAAQLQTAKSFVSETVRALEERLGVRLLDRTTRRVRPTEAGLAFYARCRRLLEEADNARAEAQSLHAAPVGKLRIGAPDGFVSRYLVPSLTGFLGEYPGIEVEFVESMALAKLVDEGLDLAIRIARVPDEGLVVRRIGTSEPVVVASPSYLAAYGAPLAPPDVARHRCVAFAPMHWRESWRLGEHCVPVRPRLLTHSTESLRAAALAGLGLVVAPDWMVRDALAAGSLVRVLEAFPAPTAGIFAVYPTNRLVTPRVRAFVDYLARDLRARGISRCAVADPDRVDSAFRCP